MGIKGIAIVYGEEKDFLYLADQSNQGRKKISARHDKPNEPNEPRKDPLSFVLFESPFTSVSKSAGATPLYSLSG
jgi:hypothetical protein